jgi:parvulin-like peptidyl-prolyl isomerase
MRILPILALAGLVSFPVLAQAPKVAPDAPVINDGPVVVDAGDISAYLLRIPEDRRGTFLTSYDRIATVADAVFIARSLASKAKAEGIDKDPIVQRRLRQAEDAVLADLYTQKVQREVRSVNLDKRARELYLADAEKYRTPEHVNVEHILVDLKGRTREMARERAREAYEQAKSGKEEFLTLAARYSDDPSKNRNGGALGYSNPASFNQPAREAIAKLKSKGDISEPIESESGFHIFRLVDRRAPETAKFEAVQRNIIETERERLQKQRAEGVIQDIRSSPTVTTHRANLEALVVPLDPEILKRAQDLHKK